MEYEQLCFCGHDCARCVTRLATVCGDNTLREQARQFYRDSLGLDIPLADLHCLGGRSNDVMSLCRDCPFAVCCRQRGLQHCTDCPDHPCPPLRDYTARYVNRANQIPQGDATMDQAQIDRINALARKAKAEGLTPEETAEQAELRRAYIESYRASLRAMLDNTVIQRPDGSREKLTPKD